MKKLLALLLTLSLVVSTLPAAVYAVTADALESAVTSEEAEPQDPERNEDTEEPTEEEPEEPSASSEEKPAEEEPAKEEPTAEEPAQEPTQDAPAAAEPQAAAEEDAFPETEAVTTTKKIKVFSETKYPLTEGVVESKILYAQQLQRQYQGAYDYHPARQRRDLQGKLHGLL